jgi:hypothetical protein
MNGEWMPMNEMEKKMLDNGFTEKDLKAFQYILDKKNSLTPVKLLHLLKRQFLLIIFAIVIVALKCLLLLLQNGDSFAIFTILFFILFFCILWFATSMRLTYKAFRFLKKNKLQF